MTSVPAAIPTRPRLGALKGAEELDAAYVGDWTPIGRTVVIEEGDRRRALPMDDSAQIGLPGPSWLRR